MEIEVAVPYSGGLAVYKVKPEKGLIFQARLDRIDGAPEHTPPERLTLVKNIGHWSGSTNRKELLDKIGYAIENQLQKSDFVFRNRFGDPASQA